MQRGEVAPAHFIPHPQTYNPEVTALDLEDLYLTRSKALHLRVNNKDTGLYIYFDAPSATQWTEDNTLVGGAYAESGILEGDRYWLNVRILMFLIASLTAWHLRQLPNPSPPSRR